MAKRKHSKHSPPKDRADTLEDQVKKLKATLRKRDKTIVQLKSEVKTVDRAWRKTETYLKEITNGKSLSEIIKTVEDGRPLSKTNIMCPECKILKVNKIIFTGFHIVNCKCGYRKRIDEEQEIGES
jgi:hypothetical protein